jgi:hypothetical protein
VKQVKDRKRSHLSGTKKRSILFVSLKISQAQMKCERMENLDATGHNAMFGDNDINFDLELESFGVEMGPLREPVERVFRAWVEDWEEEARTKMTVLPRHSCLQNIKVLSSMIPTQRNHFQFGSKIWSSAGEEVMDGSWLLFVLMMMITKMRHSHWRLHVN